MKYIANAFSLQMLKTTSTQVITRPVQTEEMTEVAQSGLTSAIGHLDTANVVSAILGVTIPMNRINLSQRG